MFICKCWTPFNVPICLAGNVEPPFNVSICLAENVGHPLNVPNI